MNGLGEFFSCFDRIVNLHHVLVHLLKVVVHELVNDLRRQVDPNVKDPVLIAILECLLQVLLNIGDDHMGATEVHRIPLTITLPLGRPLLADSSVG